MTLTLTFDLDLENFTKVKNFETYKLKKTQKVKVKVNQNVKFTIIL